MNATCALIPAAGRGARFGSPENKVFAPLLGRPLLGWTLEAFARCEAIGSVLLIGSEPDLPRLREIGERYGGGKVAGVVLGGADRQASVRNGLAALPTGTEYVVVHDGARPCITPDIIARVLEASHRIGGAATAAFPIADTLIREVARYPYGDTTIGMGGEQVPRDGLFAVQTPQAFHAVPLIAAHEDAVRTGFTGTDDTAVYRALHGNPLYLMDGSPENLKVTRPEDLALAEAILMRRLATRDDGDDARQGAAPLPYPVANTDPASPTVGQGRRPLPGSVEQPASDYTGTPADTATVNPAMVRTGSPAPPFAVGHGYDVHPFADGRRLFLGGVEFPDAPRGLAGHSDADVVLHALCDALLGAAGLGDIGKLFPPSDMRHKDRASIEFLEEVKARLDSLGWRVGNVDITVLAEAPRIGPRADDIKARIGVALAIETDRIGLKATTNEGMGFVGRGEGIAAHATALLYREAAGM